MKKFLFHHREKHHDVFNDVRKNIVSLRPRAVHVEFSASSVHRAYQKHRLVFLGGSICAILFVTFGIYRSVTWANSAVLYPSTCLGGWNNPQLAEGKPDVASADDPPAFTEANSAVLPANASSDIFCGGFTGDISQEVQPTKVTLSFSWTTKVQEASSTPLAPIIFTDVPSGSSSTFLDSSTTPPDVPTTASSTDGTLPDNKAPSTPAPTEAPADQIAPQEVPPTPIIPSDAPVSFLDFFIPRARAADNGFLDVSYTLDGNTWQDMGTIDALHMTSASFDISVASSTSWKDMANLQVRIRSISSLDPTPTVYLDGMMLTADYQNDSQDAKKVQDSLDISPDENLYVSSITNTGDAFQSSPITTGDGKAGVRFFDVQGGNLFVYKGASHDLFMSSGMGQEPVDMPLYSLPPDIYDVLNLADAEECPPTATFDECRSASSFRGESTFDVTLPSSTISSSSDATIVE